MSNYCEIFDCYEGRIRVRRNNMYGHLDLNLKEAIPTIYEEATDFFNGAAAVKKDGKWGILDKLGNWLAEPQYDSKPGMNESPFPVMKGKKWGVINNHGKIVIPIIYDDIWKDGFVDGHIAVKSGEKWGLLDDQGNTVIQLKYGSFLPLSPGYLIFSESFRFYTLPIPTVHSPSGNGLGGIIDVSGKVIVKPAYHRLKRFSCGFYAVAKSHWLWGHHSEYETAKWNFINDKGEELLKQTYPEVKSFFRDIAAVKTPSGWACIDKSGKFINDAFYEKLNWTQQNGLCFSQAMVKGKWGMLNTSLEWVIAPSYYRITDFNNGIAWVEGQKKEHRYPIDINGRRVALPVYNPVPVVDGLFIVVAEDMDLKDNPFRNLVNQKGEILNPIPFTYFNRLSSKVIALEFEGVWRFYSKEGFLGKLPRKVTELIGLIHAEEKK